MGSAALELGVAGALGEEGLDSALEIIRGEEVAGIVANRLVGGRDPALAVAAQDVLGHRVGPGRTGGELGGVGAGALVEALVVEEQVDDAPALHLLGAEEVAADHEVAGGGAAGAVRAAAGAAPTGGAD